MKYFSIDYRSPPSGMGQIIDDTQPEKTLSPVGTEVYNYILVTYPGCGSEQDDNYVLTAHFPSREAEQEGWCGPILEDLINYLRSQGVTHVYDGELSYQEEGADEEGFFPLDRWAEIMMSYL
jgi:hypothetical protein